MQRDEEDDRDPEGASGRQQQRNEQRALQTTLHEYRVGAVLEAEMEHGAPGEWWGSSSSIMQGNEWAHWPAMQQKVEAEQAATRARKALKQAATAAVVAAEAAVAADVATGDPVGLAEVAAVLAALVVAEGAAPVAGVPWD